VPSIVRPLTPNKHFNLVAKEEEPDMSYGENLRRALPPNSVRRGLHHEEGAGVGKTEQRQPRHLAGRGATYWNRAIHRAQTNHNDFCILLDLRAHPKYRAFDPCAVGVRKHAHDWLKGVLGTAKQPADCPQTFEMLNTPL